MGFMQIIRADELRVGDRMGLNTQEVVTNVVIADGTVSIGLDTPHGYALYDCDADKMIRIRNRDNSPVTTKA
jgi:hypothetical protein